ncbi:uncharacterized protein LOC121854147 [Homarus americanus]|nr:uncharacterized protein LOC121854147 [Homarus americanus]
MDYTINAPCHFKVHRYPFGTYVCNISFYLVRSTEEMAFKSSDYNRTVYRLSYDGNHDLLDYHLQEVTVESLTDHVTITLHLKGQAHYHLLNSFAPSALMFIISYATLYFPVTDFNERIMVSLTSLLVLASLFAQATDSYVRTPYYKLIDIWFAFLIILSFAVVIVNAVVNSLRINEDTVRPHMIDISLKGKMKAIKAKKFNKFCKYVLLNLFLLLLVFYFFCGAELI